MSVQVQIYKCPTRGCTNNSFKNLPPTSRSKKRFCFQCMKRHGMGVMLTWTCVECGLPITEHNIQLHLCRNCAESHRRKYHNKYWLQVRSKLKTQRRCRRCNGMIESGRSPYCTDYCKWLSWLTNYNRKIKRQLELV